MVHTLKPLIIGAKGFIGSHFYRYFRSRFPDLIGTHHRPMDGLPCMDLRAPTLDFPVSGYQYALIVGGIGNPRACEENPEESFLCNVEGPIKLGKMLLEKGIVPVFFSSEYVFDGSQALYKENTPHSPLNEYGRQKAELEKRAAELDALVIRLGKVYGGEKGDGTLFDEMLARLKQENLVKAAGDQFFAPIYIGDVIKGVDFLLHLHQRGVVNVAGQIHASRLQMAKAAARKLGVSENLIEEIRLKDLGDSFQRPNRVNLQSTIPAITWEEGLEKIVSQYAEK